MRIIDESVFDKWWTIDKELYHFLQQEIPIGSTIVELGSGEGSIECAKTWKMICIEHNEEFIDKYNTCPEMYDISYVHAPIVNGWYDTSKLDGKLPEAYSCLLVDGPPGNIGRAGILDSLQLFRSDILVIFDDVNRDDEMQLYKAYCDIMKITGVIYTTGSNGEKKFAVVDLRK